MTKYTLSTKLISTDLNGRKRWQATIQADNITRLVFSYSPQLDGSGTDFYLHPQGSFNPKFWKAYRWSDGFFRPIKLRLGSIDHISLHPNYRGNPQRFIRLHFTGTIAEVAGRADEYAAVSIFDLVRPYKKGFEFITLMKDYSPGKRKELRSQRLNKDISGKLFELLRQRKEILNIITNNRVLLRYSTLHREQFDNLLRELDEEIIAHQNMLNYARSMESVPYEDDLTFIEMDNGYTLRIESPMFNPDVINRHFRHRINLNCMIVGPSYSHARENVGDIKQSTTYVGYFR